MAYDIGRIDSGVALGGAVSSRLRVTVHGASGARALLPDGIKPVRDTLAFFQLILRTIDKRSS
jgi:hypothetical protein